MLGMSDGGFGHDRSGHSGGIGNACGIADDPAGLPFMAVAGRLVLQELCKQLRHFPRLLLLHPMAGAVHQMEADHAGARGFLHTLGGAWGLVDAPVAFAPDEHGWDVVRYACNQYRCWSRPNYYRGSGYYGYGYGCITAMAIRPT